MRRLTMDLPLKQARVFVFIAPWLQARGCLPTFQEVTQGLDLDEINLLGGTEQWPGVGDYSYTYDQCTAQLQNARGQDQHDQQRVRRRRPHGMPPSFGQNSQSAGPGLLFESRGQIRPADWSSRITRHQI